MFGLSKREQYWAAQERGTQMLVELAKAAIVAEASKPAPQLTEDDIRRIVREELQALKGEG